MQATMLSDSKSKGMIKLSPDQQIQLFFLQLFIWSGEQTSPENHG